jgi:hypothetical protein
MSLPVPRSPPNPDRSHDDDDDEESSPWSRHGAAVGAATAAASTSTAAGTSAGAAAVKVEVDVIVPVHNSASTVREAVLSALRQRRRRRRPLTTTTPPTATTTPTNGDPRQTGTESFQHQELEHQQLEIVVHVCCHDDGSTDDSWEVLQQLWEEHQVPVVSSDPANADAAHPSSTAPSPASNDGDCWEAHLHVSKSHDGVSRGAGHARNRAVELRPSLWPTRPGGTDDGSVGAVEAGRPLHQFLCMLDSDDVMDGCRVGEQVAHMMLSLAPRERRRCLLGCNFVRLPEGSTAHYAEWANGLTDERLGLERFREVTVLQPTWVRTHCRASFASVRWPGRFPRLLLTHSHFVARTPDDDPVAIRRAGWVP